MKKPLRTECEHCQGPMPTTGRVRRFCSQKCSDASYRHRNQDQRHAYNSQWQRNNRERSNAASRRYRERYRDEINAAAREKADHASRWQRRQETLGRDGALAEVRRNSLRRRFGLTPEQYDALAEQQSNRCAICGKTAEEEGRRLAVDHDHNCCPDRYKTCGGCLRGLLCTSCNNRLGVIEDAEWMSKAAAYLERTDQRGGTT